MEKITHLLKDKNAWDKGTVCGQQTNCGNIGQSIHHCFTIKINEVSCAECADAYAEQNKPVEQYNLDTAFKIIAVKDAEIARLEFENQVLRHAFKNAITEPIKFTKIEL